MKKVVVITDSSATVPAHLVQQLNIRVVPVLLIINGRTYRDGVDITPSQLYQRLRHSSLLPTTSAPSIGDFLRAYAAASQETSNILSIHLSPKLSATYAAAKAASELVDDVVIRVINCHTVAMGQGFVVLEAARAAAAGADLDTVVTRAEEIASKINLLAALDTLEYLHRGGRIGGAVRLVAAALQIKPVLYVADGHVDVFSKPRTMSKAIQLMLTEVAERTADRPIHAAILHADVPQEAEALRQIVAERFNCAELYVTEFTPVMGSHAGPGVLGIVFYAE